MEKILTGRSGLRRRGVRFFLVILAACSLVAVEFAVEIDPQRIAAELLMGSPASTIQGGLDLEPLSHLRNKILLMFGVLVMVVGIVLTSFMKNILIPLEHVLEVSASFRQGDLRPTVHIMTRDEIGELGVVMNDMASNLQEVVALSSITRERIVSVRGMLTSGSSTNDMDQALKEVQEDLDGFIDMFELYQGEK